MSDAVWTTKDGRQIKVSDMEDSHVINAIRYFFNQSQARKMVQLLDGEKGEEWSDDLFRVHDLLQEAKKRNLDISFVEQWTRFVGPFLDK